MGREQRYVPYRRVKDPTEVVVIFKTHLRDGADSEAYRKTSRRMHELVEQIPGFISIKAVHGRGRRGNRPRPFRERGCLEGVEGAAGTSRGAAPRPRGVLRSLLGPGL